MIHANGFVLNICTKHSTIHRLTESSSDVITDNNLSQILYGTNVKMFFKKNVHLIQILYYMTVVLFFDMQ